MAETITGGDEKEQATGTGEYVTFSLNNELYAVDALNVQEIIELTSITSVPHLPVFFRGVINLRGTIIPVVDLKLKFGMASNGYRKHTCIIVTEFTGGVMGMIVDAVSDVLNIAAGAITPPPEFGATIETDFLRGMGKMGDNLIIVLDVDRVLSDREVSLLNKTTACGQDGPAQENISLPDNVKLVK